jgi:hypothetical protein
VLCAKYTFELFRTRVSWGNKLFLDVLRLQLYDRVSPKINEAVEKATPYVKQTYEEAAKVTVPVAKDVTAKAVPIITVRRRRVLQESYAWKFVVGSLFICSVLWMKRAVRRARVMQEGTKNLLKASGVDVDSVARQAETASKSVTEAANVATPTVTKVVNFITTSSPETLGKIALVLVAVYYLTPFALKSAVSSLRGYAGESSFLAAHPSETFSYVYITYR